MSVDIVAEVEELSRLLAPRLDPDEVKRLLVSRWVEKYRAVSAGFWNVHEAQGRLELAESAGKRRFPDSLAHAPLDENLLGRALREQSPQVCRPVAGMKEPLARWAKKHRFASLAAQSLAQDSHLYGVLLVAFAHKPPHSLLALLRLQARVASVALRDTQLIASTRKSLAKLRFLVEASKALSATLDLGELLGRILEVARDQAAAERGSIFLVDEKTQEIWSLIAHGLSKQEIRLPIGHGIAGHVAASGETVNVSDAYRDPRFNPAVDQRTGFRTRNILCLPIRNKTGKIIAVLQLLNKKGGNFSEEDTDFLLTLSGHVALALENAQLHQALLEKERLDQEIALARGIQRNLLPHSTPSLQGFEVAVLNEPCYEVGGDYYDFLSLGPQTLLVAIADVEGKGVSSALVMSNLQATLHTLILQVHSLDAIADSVNRLILADTHGSKYLSLFLGLLDLRRRSIHYINCGHVPPVIVRAQEEPVELTEGGLVVGLFENVSYQRGSQQLASGDVMILCTDGVTEAMDAQRNEYGLERVVACVRQALPQKASEIVTALSADVARFSQYGTHVDDRVIIAIKVA